MDYRTPDPIQPGSVPPPIDDVAPLTPPPGGEVAPPPYGPAPQADSTPGRAERAADSAREETRQVAATARDQASRVRGEVATQGRNLLQEAKGQLRTQAGTQTDQLGEAVAKTAGQVRALLDGRPDDAGPVRDYVEQAAGRIDDMAQRIRSRGFDGLAEDLQRFARRRPGVFLLGAAAAGFAVGRIIRGATAGEETSEPPTRPGPETMLPPSRLDVPPAGTWAEPAIPGPGVAPSPRTYEAPLGGPAIPPPAPGPAPGVPLDVGPAIAPTRVPPAPGVADDVLPPPSGETYLPPTPPGPLDEPPTPGTRRGPGRDHGTGER